MTDNSTELKRYLYLIFYKRWLIVLTALIIMTGSIVFCYSLPKMYEAKSTVFIEKNVLSELVKGLAVTPSMEQTIKVITYAMTSRTLLEKVVKELDMDLNKGGDAQIEKTIKRINKNIKVTLNKDNTLFTISYFDANPRLARDFVNTLVKLYIEQNVSSKREESYGAIKFFSDEIKTVKEKLDKADSELNMLKGQQGGIININESKLFEEINAAQQKLHDTQLRRRHLEELRPVTKREHDPLQTQLMALQKRQEELRTQFNENYPELIKVRGEIEELKLQIKKQPPGGSSFANPQEIAKIEAELNAVKIAEQGLKHYIETNQSLFRRIPTAKASIDQLETEKRKQKELYDQLLAKQGQSEVSKQIEVQDKTTTYRIVDPAVQPNVPSSPDRIRILLMGVILGIAGGIGLVILYDQLDQTIKSVEMLKAVGLPLLALIPKIPEIEIILKQKKRDRIYTICSSLYMSVIIAVIGMEAAGLPYIDKLANRISQLF